MTARIEPIRRAAALPERTPEREALAKAIARDAELEAEIARVEEALRKARGLASSAEREISELEGRLSAAREGAPQRLVNALLAGAAAEDDPAEAIGAALVKARASLETSERAIAMLVEQHRGLTGRRVFSRVEAAIGAVMMSESFPDLLARHEELRLRFAESGAVLGILFQFSNYDPTATRPVDGFTGAAAHAMRGYFARLRGDPDALPIEPPGDALGAA